MIISSMCVLCGCVKIESSSAGSEKKDLRVPVRVPCLLGFLDPFVDSVTY